MEATLSLQLRLAWRSCGTHGAEGERSVTYLCILFILTFFFTNPERCSTEFILRSLCLTCTVYTTPVLTNCPSLWELLHVRPSAMTSKMYISPHGRSVMSQPVSDVVQQVASPFLCSSVAVYVTAPGVADHVMLTV